MIFPTVSCIQLHGEFVGAVGAFAAACGLQPLLWVHPLRDNDDFQPAMRRFMAEVWMVHVQSGMQAY